MCSKRQFLALWSKLVAMHPVAKQIVNRPKLLRLVQPSARIHLTHHVVGLTTLKHIQVIVAVNVFQHLLAGPIVALASPVERHIHRHLVELPIRLVIELTVSLVHQVIVIPCPDRIHQLRHLAAVSLVHRLLVLGIVR